MARPTTKDSLLTLSEQNYQSMCTLIESMPQTIQLGTFPFEDRDRNIRDVLIHLYEWQQLLLNWVKENQQGNTLPFLPAPYNWKTYPEMNIQFWQKHQNTPLDKAKTQLAQSHQQVIKLINSFSDKALFTKKYFPWTGTTSLGSCCASSTSSHYDWAIKKIKKYKKML